MTTTSRMLSTLNKFRKQLSAHETSAEQAINTSYAGVLGGIRSRMSDLYQQIEQKQSQDETVPVSWLHEQNRLTNIKAFIAGEINRFGSLALMTTQQLQQIGVNLGSQAAQELLHATVPNGVHWNFGRPSSEALRAFIGVSQSGSPLYELFHGFGAEAAKKVGDALLLGLSLGQNPRRIASQVEQALGISRNRALVISRDALNNAYRNGNMESFRANSDVVSKYRRTCAKSARSCAACIALDGTLYDLDEDFALHPCDRCTMLPVTKDWSEILAPLGIDASSIPDTRAVTHMQTGLEWFEEQDAATQQAIIGSKRGYEAYKAGEFSLKDMISHSFDKDWGHGIAVKPLKELVK
jgi:SPP1 gp7 family putative phage head morphogenesis protein